MEQTGALSWADAGSTLLMLLVVLVVIILLAGLVRKLNMRMPTYNSPVKILSSVALGPKERLVIVSIGEQKLLLGVTAHQIQLLQTLPDDFKVKDTDKSASSSFAQQVITAIRRDR
ncbi:flagellar biosynthetic protein FliO [Aliidiomarina minuta]|uniref:Flagellar protein n=1 Tax=Aliidiomarina minuta TaxID=880057 RepID=A0A432W510_9GAMM|nr:flagellar biosynthetic protein FliO [Aliidiomarina minuta]RUO24514.1 flagellar biosynthetic protein FliO [Aliidiomarina minuta]